MKIETILKSAMIMGLLAGVTDTHAANLKGDIHCPVVTVHNKSLGKSRGDPAYSVQVLYRACDSGGTGLSKTVDPGKTEVIDGIFPNSEVRVDKLQLPWPGTPNLWTGQSVGTDVIIECIGTLKAAGCAAVLSKK